MIRNLLTSAFLFLCVLLNQSLIAPNVQGAIDLLINNDALKSASVSIHVHDLSSQTVLGEHDALKSLTPASSLKLITTGVALELLGKDFKYETKLVANNHNVYLVGSGDPSLGSPQSYYTDNTESLFLKFAAAAAKASITEVHGGVIAVADVFDTAPVGDSWPWYDLGNYYASGVWGINIRENYYDLFLDQSPMQNKAPQCCGTDPEIPGIQFINELVSGAPNSGDNAYIYGAPYGYQKFIRGSIPSGSGTFKIKGSIPEPPLLAAQLLDKALNERNISTALAPAYSFDTPTLSGSQSIYTHYSPRLLDIITETNRKSINLYAETLLKTLSYHKNGKPGTFKKGIQVIYDHLKSKGIDIGGLYLVDGSGMSPRNGVNSKHFTDFLGYIFQNKNLYSDYKSSLAIIGEEGTLQYMMKGHPITGHLFGKSGSMERVRSYTGYIESQSGKTIAFSIIINNYAGKSRPVVKLIENIFAEIYQH